MLGTELPNLPEFDALFTEGEGPSFRRLNQSIQRLRYEIPTKDEGISSSWINGEYRRRVQPVTGEQRNPIDAAAWYANAVSLLQAVLLIHDYHRDAPKQETIRARLKPVYDKIRTLLEGVEAPSEEDSDQIEDDILRVIAGAFSVDMAVASRQVIAARDEAASLVPRPKVKTTIEPGEESSPRGNVHTTKERTPIAVGGSPVSSLAVNKGTENPLLESYHDSFYLDWSVKGDGTALWVKDEQSRWGTVGYTAYEGRGDLIGAVSDEEYDAMSREEKNRYIKKMHESIAQNVWRAQVVHDEKMREHFDKALAAAEEKDAPKTTENAHYLEILEMIKQGAESALETSHYAKLFNGGFNFRLEWFRRRCQMLGLAGENPKDNAYHYSWLGNFYKHNFAKIRAARVAGVSSSRSKPLPACLERQDNTVRVERGGKPITRHCRWIRMGAPLILSEGWTDKTAERKSKLKFAQSTFYTLIKANFDEQLQRYFELYKDLKYTDRPPFFISYASLFTPMVTDLFNLDPLNNNQEMEEIASLGFQMAAEEFYRQLQKWRLHGGERGSEYDEVDIRFTHTNHIVNRFADNTSWSSWGTYTQNVLIGRDPEVAELSKKLQWVASISLVQNGFDEAQKTQMQSMFDYITGKSQALNFNEADGLINSIEQGIAPFEGGVCPWSEKLRAELATRFRASVALRRLLNNEAPFNALSHDKRNLMCVALELLAMGEQCLFLTGCKSARERYGIAADAFVAMLEDERCMTSWELLQPRMAQHMQSGHVEACNREHVAGAQKAWQVGRRYERSSRGMMGYSRRNRYFIKPRSFFLQHKVSHDLVTIGKRLLWGFAALVFTLVVVPAVTLAVYAAYRLRNNKRQLLRYQQQNEALRTGRFLNQTSQTSEVKQEIWETEDYPFAAGERVQSKGLEDKPEVVAEGDTRFGYVRRKSRKKPIPTSALVTTDPGHIVNHQIGVNPLPLPKTNAEYKARLESEAHARVNLLSQHFAPPAPQPEEEGAPAADEAAQASVAGGALEEKKGDDGAIVQRDDHPTATL